MSRGPRNCSHAASGRGVDDLQHERKEESSDLPGSSASTMYPSPKAPAVPFPSLRHSACRAGPRGRLEAEPDQIKRAQDLRYREASALPMKGPRLRLRPAARPGTVRRVPLPKLEAQAFVAAARESARCDVEECPGPGVSATIDAGRQEKEREGHASAISPVLNRVRLAGPQQHLEDVEGHRHQHVVAADADEIDGGTLAEDVEYALA